MPDQTTREERDGTPIVPLVPGTSYTIHTVFIPTCVRHNPTCHKARTSNKSEYLQVFLDLVRTRMRIARSVIGHHGAAPTGGFPAKGVNP